MAIRILKSRELANNQNRFFIDANSKVMDSSGIILYRINKLTDRPSMKQTSIFGGVNYDNQINTSGC